MCWTGQVPHQILPGLSDDWRPSLASGSHACSFGEGACGGGQTVAWKRNLRATQLPGFRRRNAKSRAGKWGRNGTVFRRSLGQGLMGFGAPRDPEGGARSEGGGRAAPLPWRGAALPGKGGTCPDRAFARVARPAVERERGSRRSAPGEHLRRQRSSGALRLPKVRGRGGAAAEPGLLGRGAASSPAAPESLASPRRSGWTGSRASASPRSCSW